LLVTRRRQIGLDVWCVLSVCHPGMVSHPNTGNALPKLIGGGFIAG
jgi:hypothetical protein